MSKELLTTVLWFAGIALGIYGLTHVSKNQKKEEDFIISNGLETTVKVVDNSGKFIELEYYIDGVEYSEPDGRPFSFMYVGEIFKAKFLPDDPTGIIVLYDEPIFPNDFNYEFVEIAETSKSGTLLEYMYQVNGQEYRRVKYMNDDQYKNPHNYLVKYRTEQPMIGYVIKEQ